MMFQGKTAAFWGVALLVLAALVIFCLNLAVGLYHKFFSPNAEQEIAQHIVLKGDWLNVKSQDALKTQREVQEILFEFEHPMAEFDTARPYAQVEAASPKVELLDEYGQYFPFRFGGASQNAIRYRAVAELPKDSRKYVGLRVKSQMDIPVRRVYWNCYDPWDRK